MTANGIGAQNCAVHNSYNQMQQPCPLIYYNSLQ